jgi:hypothetical protein
MISALAKVSNRQHTSNFCCNSCRCDVPMLVIVHTTLLQAA